MEPSGVLQPPRDAAYQTEDNAATSNPDEKRAAHHHGGGRSVAERFPGDQSSSVQEAVPSSLGWGVRGAPAGKERPGQTPEAAGRQSELDGEQMRAPAEGQVADAVDRKPGATGSQPDLASDLDRKKREQAEARNAIMEERRHGRTPDGGPRGGVDTELDKTF
ncbi:hypothetical protein SAMD00023353_1800040 [Rosellinia necatrix]|uniref:Uncharacterized protein n=1 Tax=Rosellinia necatrix TaxID=77044 RepID=A0A1W2TEF1_ROSNE|nr:hypothetical protein SAMD00023353_1800040 [Rosellinia necatrix]